MISFKFHQGFLKTDLPQEDGMLILLPIPSFTSVPLSFHFTEERKPQSHLMARGELTGDDAQFEGSP